MTGAKNSLKRRATTKVWSVRHFKLNETFPLGSWHEAKLKVNLVGACCVLTKVARTVTEAHKHIDSCSKYNASRATTEGSFCFPPDTFQVLTSTDKMRV